MYYWQIINFETGEILEGSKRYKTIRGAHAGAQNHVMREMARFEALEDTFIDITVFDSENKAVATTYKFLASYVYKTELRIRGEL